jgi:3-phenylpropionate/cinnamic acid dioxygenase small subunit
MDVTATARHDNGAIFVQTVSDYRCALQVNPFTYQGRHGKQTVFQNEAEYNNARRLHPCCPPWHAKTRNGKAPM